MTLVPEVVRRSLIDPEALGPMKTRLGAGAFGEVRAARYAMTVCALKKVKGVVMTSSPGPRSPLPASTLRTIWPTQHDVSPVPR